MNEKDLAVRKRTQGQEEEEGPLSNLGNLTILPSHQRASTVIYHGP